MKKFIKKLRKHILVGLGSLALISLTVIGLIYIYNLQKTPRIVQAKSGDNLYVTQNTSFEAGFGVKDDPSKIVFRTGEKSLTFSLSYNDIKWQKEEDTLIASVSDSLAFSYTLLDSKNGSLGLKEDIVLKKPPFKEESAEGETENGQSALDIQNRFEFTLGLNGLTPKRDAEGLWHFYDEQGEDLFYIPHPYMEDSAGLRSEAVQLDVTKDSLIVEVDREWLLSPERKYPIIIDPTFKLTILTVHSHPQQGDDWAVEFTTQGKADLTITPDDQATIDDIDFVSLTCDGEERQPQILENDVLYYQDWECDNTAKLTHLVNTAAPHRLKFQFGDEVTYAYNAPGSTTYTFSGVSQATNDYYAFEDYGATVFSGPDDTGTSEATDTDYTNIQSDNAVRWESANATNVGDYDAQLYKFYIDESESTVTQLDLKWNGYGGMSSGYTTYLYIYDYNSAAWELLTSQDFTSANDSDLTDTISSNPQNYIDTDGEVVLMVKSEFCMCDGGIPCNSDTTINGDVVYYDADCNMWTETRPGTYVWGGYGINNPDDSCVGDGSGYPACHHCDTLTYAGYSDWELPSCTNDDNLPDSCQLYQLGVDNCGWTGGDGGQSSCTPSWDSNASSYGYWSSSESYSSIAWLVYFGAPNSGYVHDTNKSSDRYVRCVR